MSFSEALVLLSEGKTIARHSWYSVFPFNSFLILVPEMSFGNFTCEKYIGISSKSNNKIKHYDYNQEDILANDWIER
jgi:hypothetical protein